MQIHYTIAGLLLASPLINAAPSPQLNVVDGVIQDAPPLIDPAPSSPLNVIDGVIQDAPQKRSANGGCNADNLLRNLRNSARSAIASEFCSAYLKPTSTVTSATTLSLLFTESTTSTVTATTTTTSLTTQTAICASPRTQDTVCGFDAFGFSSNVISSDIGLSGAECEQLCLRNPSCRSFQIDTGVRGVCNIYRTLVIGNVQAAPGGGFTFYERNCGQFTPAECGDEVLPRRLIPGDAKRDAATPTALVGIEPSRITSACRCLITFVGTPSTQTVTSSVTSTTSSTITTSFTDTVSETSTTSSTTTTLTTAAP